MAETPKHENKIQNLTEVYEKASEENVFNTEVLEETEKEFYLIAEKVKKLLNDSDKKVQIETKDYLEKQITELQKTNPERAQYLQSLFHQLLRELEEGLKTQEQEQKTQERELEIKRIIKNLPQTLKEKLGLHKNFIIDNFIIDDLLQQFWINPEIFKKHLKKTDLKLMIEMSVKEFIDIFWENVPYFRNIFSTEYVNLMIKTAIDNDEKTFLRKIIKNLDQHDFTKNELRSMIEVVKDKDSGNFFRIVRYIKDKDIFTEKELKLMIEKALTKDTLTKDIESFFWEIMFFKSIFTKKELATIIESNIKKIPGVFLSNIRYLNDLFTKEEFKSLIEFATKKAPESLLQNAKSLKKIFTKEESKSIIKLAAERAPFAFFQAMWRFEGFFTEEECELIEQKKQYLNKFLGSKNKKEEKKSTWKFIRDEAITFKDIYIWKAILTQNGELKKEVKEIEKTIPDIEIMILRNLYFTKKEINSANIKNEIQEIKEMRAYYGKLKIWKDRNIVLGSHNEIWDWEGNLINRFGNPKMKEELESKGKSLQHFEPLLDNSDLTEIKKNTLDAIKNTKPPFTFLFDGHGGPDGLYFTQGEADKLETSTKIKEIKISPEELGDALMQRNKNFGIQLKKNPDIFILSACYNHTYIRNVYTYLKKQESEAVMPIFIGMSEYNQYGHGDDPYNYGNKFNKNIIESETLNDFWKHATPDDKQSSNPSVYVPPLQRGDGEENLRHIAEINNKSSEKDNILS